MQSDSTILWCLLGIFLAAAIIVYYDTDKRIERIERNNCAWIFYEDGSAAPRTNDTDRYRCLQGR